MRKRTAAQFFFRHAGYSYDPKTETRLQGRWRGARRLAWAETQAQERGWSAEWQHEESWTCGDLGCDRQDNHEHEVLYCILRDGTGSVIGSLGMIEMSPVLAEARAYGRVVEAELASEALAERGE